MEEFKARMTFDEEVLGMAPAQPEIYREYIASKAADAPTKEEEVEAIGVDEVVEKGLTVFPTLDDGTPFMYDYQIKGMFKDSCGMLRRVKGTKSEKLSAYKKIIDGLIFVKERKIPFRIDGSFVTKDVMGVCERPLRASSPSGERVAIAASKTVPAGAYIEFTVQMLDAKFKDAVIEWLDYGAMRGFGQWRNSGKGRYHWEQVD